MRACTKQQTLSAAEPLNALHDDADLQWLFANWWQWQ